MKVTGITKKDIVENIIGCTIDGLAFVLTGHHSGYCVSKTTENVTKLISSAVTGLIREKSDMENDFAESSIIETSKSIKFENYKFFGPLEDERKDIESNVEEGFENCRLFSPLLDRQDILKDCEGSHAIVLDNLLRAEPRVAKIRSDDPIYELKYPKRQAELWGVSKFSKSSSQDKNMGLLLESGFNREYIHRTEWWGDEREDHRTEPVKGTFGWEVGI